MNKFFSIAIIGLFSCSIAAFAFADADGSNTASPVVPALIDVDGVKLTLADFGRKHPGGLFHAYQTFYQTERKVVEEYIDEYLLEREAQKEKVTVAELLERHVNSVAAKDPSEEVLRMYYETVETDQPYDSVRQQIIDHIRGVRQTKANTAYMKSLRAAAHIKYQFGPPRAQISLKDTPVRGLPDAPVTIVEYADYECPYCQQAQTAIDQIEAEYKGKIAFAYKDMPLPNHAHAQKAAEATHCAGAQGKYWEYHDMLFKTKALDLPQLKDHAQELKLDTAAFDKCLASDGQAKLIKDQFTEGVSYGLQGTPGFFINGRFLSGSPTVEELRTVIGEEMAVSAKGKETAKR